MRRWIALIGCLFLLAGCGGGGSDTGSTDGLLAGRWVRTSNVPGSSFSLLLTTSGSEVNGTGVYAIEAGRSGVIQVTGRVMESQFMLNLMYDTGVTAVYTGARTDDNHLSGTVQQPGSADFTLALTRQ